MVMTLAGLSINFVGTVLVAFSVQRGDVWAWKESEDKPNYMMRVKLGMFRWGIGLLAVGFLLQIVSVVGRNSGGVG